MILGIRQVFSSDAIKMNYEPLRMILDQRENGRTQHN
jgi:hypothetical protein